MPGLDRFPWEACELKEALLEIAEKAVKMAEKLGDRVIGTAMVEEPCDLRINRRDLKPHRDTLKEADSIMVLSCGAGVQTIADYTGKS